MVHIVFVLFSLYFGNLFNDVNCGKEPPKIYINNVTIAGSVGKTWHGNAFWSFRGIRYAQPPINKLRFKDPERLDITDFQETYDATNDKNDCPSLYAINPSEDCLFLNVYTKPITLNSTFTKLKPVIVFIHPGGFYIGSGLSNFVGPEYLMEKSIVIVTFNYRLGTLGFLNYGTEQYPGNAGLKDQVFALRWIKQYISYFGGNQDDITLMGYSAGAVSVNLHLVSKMSTGLFHKAIIMSGAIPPQAEISLGNQLKLIIKQAEIVGCSSTDIKDDLIDCLNSKNAHELSINLRQMFEFGKDNPIYLWFPIIENDFGQERFLTDSPYKLLQQGTFNKVPILIGYTDKEFCTSAKDIITNTSLLDMINSGFEKIAPICFMYNNSQENKTKKISQRILDYYFHNKTINKESFDALCDIFSDSIIRFGSNELTKLASLHTAVYRYRFSYFNRFSNLYYPGPTDVNGAEHMDDLMYLFKMNHYFKPTDPEAAQVELMTSLIVNFTSSDYSSKYQDLEYKTGKYIEITNNIIVKNDSYFPTFDFYRDLFL